MKQINVRFVMLVLTALVVCGGIVFAVHRFQTRRYADFFSERAATAEAAGNLADAAQDLNLYLGLRPDDDVARVRLGLVLADAGQNYAAFATLEPALRNLQEDDPAARLRLVDVLLQLQRWKDARAHLQDYLLKSQPENPEYLDRLAQCQLADKEVAEAQKSLELAIEKAPQQVGPYVKLVALLKSHPELASQQGTTLQDATFWLNRLLEQNPREVTGYLLRAQHRLETTPSPSGPKNSDSQPVADVESTTLALQDTEKALALARKAKNQSIQLRERIQKGTDLAGVADMLQGLRPYLSAITIADIALADAIQSVANASSSERVQKDLQKVDGTIKLVEFESLMLDMAARTAMVRATPGEPNPDQLAAIRKQGAEANSLIPDNQGPYQSLAEIELLAGNRSEAIEWLRKGTQAIKSTALKSKSVLPVALVRLLLESNLVDQAKVEVNELKGNGYPIELTEYLAARVDYAQGEWPNAVTLLTNARLKAVGSPDLLKEIEFWLGQARLKTGEDVAAAEAFRRAVVIDSTFTAARLALAETLERLGSQDEAVLQYRVALGDTPEAALQALRVEVRQHFRLPRSVQNWSDIETRLSQLEQALPKRFEVPLLQVDVLRAQQRGVDAKAILERACSRIPTSVELRCALVEAISQEGDYSRCDALLTDAKSELGDRAALRLMRAKLAAQRDLANASPIIRDCSENAEEMSKEDRLRLWRGLIVLATVCQDKGLALELCEELCDVDRSDISSWLTMLAAAIEFHDDQGADKAIVEITRIEGSPDGPIRNYCMAARLEAEAAAKNDPAIRDAARRHIRQSLSMRPQWDAALVLAGRLDEQSGNRESALKHYLAGIEAGTDQAIAYQNAVQLLLAQGRYNEADGVLKRLESRLETLSPDVQRLRSQISGRLNDLDTSLSLARKVAVDSDRYQDQLWLAAVCGTSAARKRTAGLEQEATTLTNEAEQALVRARELGPDAPETWGRYLQFLASNNRSEEMKSILLEATGKFDDSPGAVAALCVAAGLTDEAASHYQAALQRWPEDVSLALRAAEFSIRTGRPQMGSERLREIVSGKVPATAIDLIIARRYLALALQNEGRFSSLNAALALIEENLRSDPNSVLDMRTKATLLAQHPGRSRREEAIDLLEQLVQFDAAGATETRSRLAQLYLTQGDWDRAIVHLRLAKDLPTSTLCVRGLIERNQLSEAEVELNRLVANHPNAPVAIVLRAELLFHRGDYNTILGDGTSSGIFLEFLHSINDATARSLTLTLFASALENFSAVLTQRGESVLAARFAEQAGSLWQAYRETGIQGDLAFARYLGRHDRLDEAIAVLDNALPKADLPECIGTLQELVASSSENEKALARIEPIIANQISVRGREQGLLIAEVELRTAQRRFDEVESLYRELLTRFPDNAMAIENNLAFLLALRGEKLDEALMLITSAIEKAGPFPTLIDTRGTVRLARGDLPLAIQDFREAIQQQPTANQYFHLAWALEKAGQPAEASKVFREAVNRGIAIRTVHPLSRTVLQQFLDEASRTTQ